MPLKAGTTSASEFASSMAAAIENALKEEYQNVKGESLPTAGQVDRRMLFAAIAQGVVRHLHDNASSIKVAVDATTHATTVTVEITGILYS
jgi:hypothetical protein